MDTKTCTKCNISKSLSEFYLCKGHPQPHCKQCKKLYSKQYKQTLKNPEVKANRIARAEILKERRSRGVKLCRKCNTEQVLSEFYVEKNGVTGSKCKTCLAAHNKIWQKNNSEKREIQRKRQKVNNPARFLYQSSKIRARQKNLEFNIQKSDIIISEKCPVFNTEFTYNRDRATSPSLDRIDNSKGYIKGNVIVISYRANELKRDSSVEDLTKIIDFYQNIDNYKSNLSNIELIEQSRQKYSWHAIQDPVERSRLRRLEYKNNVTDGMLSHARFRAKQFGREFNLTHSDIKIPKVCPIFGIPLEISGDNIETSPSIDRIDNTKGYIAENIIIVSYKVNRAKGDSSIEDLISIRDFYRNLQSRQ